MELDCPGCGYTQDVSDCLCAHKACDDIEYECTNCEYAFLIGWTAEAELR